MLKNIQVALSVLFWLIMALAGIVTVVFSLIGVFIGFIRSSTYLNEHISPLERDQLQAAQLGRKLSRYDRAKLVLLRLLKFVHPMKWSPSIAYDSKSQTLIFQPHGNIELDSPEWFEWLAAYHNQSFYVREPGTYDDWEHFDAYRDRHKIWTASRKIGDQGVHRYKIGRTDQVTAKRLCEVVQHFSDLHDEWAEQSSKTFQLHNPSAPTGTSA